MVSTLCIDKRLEIVACDDLTLYDYEVLEVVVHVFVCVSVRLEWLVHSHHSYHMHSLNFLRWTCNETVSVLCSDPFANSNNANDMRSHAGIDCRSVVACNTSRFGFACKLVMDI